jgi:carbon monoxide dehydrogenase subunit G
MLRVQRTFTIDRPLATVFDYLADFCHTEQWDPGTITTTRTNGGPLQRGARFHNVSTFRGKRTELDYELIVFDPRSHLVFEGNNKTATATDDLTFRPSGAGVEIQYEARFALHGLAKLSEPFIKGGLDPLADETVKRMSGVLASL